MKTLSQIVVIKQHGHWLMRCQRLGKRQFASRRAALKAAIDAAEQGGKDGYPAEVVVLDGANAVKLWRYGEDTYPPKFPAEVWDAFDTLEGSPK